MPKKLPDELRENFFAAHQAGKSYRRIGQDYGVDWRTVKGAVEQLRQVKTADHWEQVYQRVDAQELQRHYRELLGLAEQVQDVLHLHPLTGTVHRAGSGFLEALLARRAVLAGGEVRPSGESERALRLRARLLVDLYGHVPKLETWVAHALEAWYGILDERVPFEDAARHKLLQAGVPAPEVAPLVTHAIATAVCRVADDVAGAPSPLAHVSAQIETAHQDVVQELEQRLNGSPLIDEYRSLVALRHQVDAVVDGMVLSGIVEGECSLYPVPKR